MPEAHYSSILAYDPADEYRPEPSPPPQLPVWMDGGMRIGVHTSIAGHIASSLDLAHRIGCNTLQIFSASPRMWPRPGTRLAAVDAQKFRARRSALALGPLAIHDNYLINLASQEPMLRVRSIQALHDELSRALALGADYLVIHPGCGRGCTLQRAIETIAQALDQAAKGLHFNGLRILLENTSGQGSAIGSRFEELQAILRACPELPLGVCLDTAHLFQAGHDIRHAEGLEKTLEEVERAIGLERVFMLHVNDSKTPLGSRVDRHQHIGKGHIGLGAFRRILNHPLLAGRAFILETPIDRPGDDRRNVSTLWRLAGMRPRSRRRGEPVIDGFSKAARLARRSRNVRKKKRASSASSRTLRGKRNRRR
jgi:deoxyribonuclease IV